MHEIKTGLQKKIVSGVQAVFCFVFLSQLQINIIAWDFYFL